MYVVHVWVQRNAPISLFIYSLISTSVRYLDRTSIEKSRVVKTCLRVCQSGPTQSGLYIQGRWDRGLIWHCQRSENEGADQLHRRICTFVFALCKNSFFMTRFKPVFSLRLTFLPSHVPQLSLFMRKPAFCICENKDPDQLRSNCAADQRLCCRFTNSTLRLLPKSEIISL